MILVFIIVNVSHTIGIPAIVIGRAIMLVLQSMNRPRDPQFL